MKKLVIALFALVCCFASKAQLVYWPSLETPVSMEKYISRQQKLHDSIKREGITKLSVYRKYYKKDGTLKRAVLAREEFYDSNGRAVEFQYYTHKGKASNRYVYGYEANGVESSFAWYEPDGDYRTGWNLHFNDKGQMVKVEGVCRGGKNCYNQEFEYNDKGYAVKIKYFSDGKQASTIEREYFSDGQLKETRNYNRKGKLRSVIKYDCTPVGAIAGSKAADTITKCSKTTMDSDSNTIYTYETIRPDGKIQRSVIKINKRGQNVEFTIINYKGQMVYSERRKYNKVGRVAEVEFLDDWSKTSGPKQRYEYDNKGHVSQTAYYNEKGKLTHETVYGFD